MAVACVVAAALLAPAVAAAGTYDVVACAAPGAGGVNHSLTSYIGSYDPARQAEANRSYELDGSCAGGLIARSHPLHTTAPWLTDGGWRFDAPAGTEITRVVSWRFGEARDFGDDPATPFVDEGDHWRVALTDGTGQFVGGPAGGETCAHGLNIPACTIGEPNGGRSQHDVRTNALRWAVSCGGEIVGGCPTSYADPITAPGYPLATIALHGTAITLTDPSAPALSLGGPLFGGGWRKPSDGATYSASDNSGIRTAELTVGPAGARDDRACDFTYKVPCANATDRPLALAAAPPDGTYTGRLTVTDASGNPASVEKPVMIDGTAPSVSLKRPKRGSIIVGVTDWFSGLAAGQIQVRNGSSEPYRPLMTEYRKGALRARLDRGNLQRADVWVSVRDNAGNEAAGTPSRFTLTSVSSGGRRKRVSKGQVRVRFGRTARIRGRLAFATGQPLAGVPVSITSAPGSGGVPVAEGSAQTNASGRFGITVPAGRRADADDRLAGRARQPADRAPAAPVRAGVELDPRLPHAPVGRGPRPLLGPRARRAAAA